MKRLFILSIFTSLVHISISAQIKIGDNPQTIDPSSLLELESNSRVLVITKVSTAQMESIVPQRGGMVYNTDRECIHYYDGTQWINLCDAVSFNITNDPIENLRSTIAITQTPNSYNLEVAPNSIRSEQIVDESINGVDLQDNSIGRDKLGDAAVGPNELATESVDSDAIIDFTIQPRDIALAGPNQVLATTVNGVVEWQDALTLQGSFTDGNTITGNGTAADPLTLALAIQNAIADNSYAIDEHVGLDNDIDNENELTDIEFDKDTNILSLTNSATPGGQVADLSALVGSDDQELNLTGNILEITGGNNVNLGAFLDNTDQQQLSINGNEITISGGNSINLPPGTVDTDNQDLSLAGTALNITDGAGVNLEPLIETVVGDNGYLTTEVDGDITNELQDLNFDPATNILTLSTPGTPGNQADLSSLAGGGAADGVITNMELQGTDLVVTGTAPGFNGTIALGGLGGAGTLDLEGVLGNGTSAGNNQINDLADPTDLQDAATQNYVETRIATILGAGGADGVVSNINPTATGFDVTGTNGGFNGSIDLDATFATDIELSGINIVSSDTPNSITTGVDGGALYDDTALSNAIIANTIAIAAKEDTANKSNDPTLADNSETDFPTEQAVKTYVDNQISTVTAGNNLSNSNLTQAGEDRTYDLNNQNLVFTGLGSVGIGNGANPPQNKFHVAGEIRVEGVNSADGTLANPAYTFSGDTNNDTGMYRPAADEIGFSVGGQEALRMEEDGGTTNVTIFQSLTLENVLLDKDGDAGAAGQILSSTGTQTDWIDAPTTGAVDWSALTGIPAGFNDNIDNVLDEAAVDGFVANNGYLTAEVDGSITNEIQILSILGNDLTLSNGGGTVTIPSAGATDWSTLTGIPTGFNDNIDNVLDEAAVDGFVANNGYLTAEVDGSITNEIQILSILGNDLTLSNGGGTVTIPSAGAADWSTLTGIPAGFNDNIDNVLDEATVDGFVANNGYLTAEVDGSITNEIQILSILGNDLTLSNGGGTVTIPSAGAADWSTLTGIPAGFNDNIDDNSTNVSLNVFGPDLVLTDSNGFTVSVPMADIDSNSTNVSLDVFGPDLVLTDSNGFTVSVPMADIDSNSTNVSLTVAGSELILFDSDGNDVRVPIADISAQYTPGAGIAISTANVISVDGGSIAAGSIPGLAVVPNFGAQDIITTGNITAQDATFNGDVAVTGTHTPVPDYVFQKYFLGSSELNDRYRFQSLEEIEKFIKINHHLPGVTSALTAKKEGSWNLSKSNLQNLEKIEELFLHTIEQEKKIESLQEENTQLSKELEVLKSQVETIQKMLAKDNE